MTTSTEMSWKVEQVFHDQHPEISFPEDAIAHLYIAIDRIQRQIYLLQEQGVDEGSVEPYSRRRNGKTTVAYNHVLPQEQGKRVRRYLPKAEVGRKRAEIQRGKEVKRLKKDAEQIEQVIASLKHRAGGRVEEGAIAS